MANASATASTRAGRAEVRSVGAHLALAAASAVLLGLAFPEPGWGWLAHVALAPVALLAIRTASVKRLLWTTYLVWCAWWLIRLRWLAPVTAGGYAALCAYLAVYTPAALWTVRWLHRRHGGAVIMTLPIVWVSLELVRGWFVAGGFGWFAIAHTQAPHRVGQAPGHLLQVADLFGEQGVGFLVLMTNGLIVDLLTRPVFRVRGWRRRLDRTIRAALLLWLVTFAAAWAYGHYRLHESPPGPQRSLRVAVVQTNVPQDNKTNPTPEQRAHDWDRMVELTRQAAAASPPPTLIIWPETMVPAALNAEALDAFAAAADALAEKDPARSALYNKLRSYHSRIQQLARDTGSGLIVGAPAYGFRDPDRKHNSAYYYHPDGSQDRRRYDKTHLVPFGEYLPWVGAWPWLKKQFIHYLSPYDYDYSLTPGREWTVYQWPPDRVAPRRFPSGSPAHGAPRVHRAGNAEPVRVAVSICFEDAVARVARNMIYDHRGAKRADLLVNLTNDGWYAGPSQRPQHLQIAVFRCVENRVPMARSVNTGISGFIDSVGRIGPVVERDGLTQRVDGYAVEQVHLDERVTLFGRWGHAPAVVLAAFTASLVIAGLARPDRRTARPRRLTA